MSVAALSITGCLPGLKRAAAMPRTGKPNIVFFLVDDMGWVDCGVYGSNFYETPNIDKLASEGMLFTDAYAASPLCSPTRASLMTGKWPARLHIDNAIVPVRGQKRVPAEFIKTAKPKFKMVPPGTLEHLDLEELTIAEELKGAGYKTGFFGKWHIGGEPYTPDNQGFDINVGGSWYHSPISYFDPYQNHRIENRKKGEYLTDRLTEEACKFMQANKDEPFLVNLWHYAVHSPFAAKDRLTEKYEAKADPTAEQHNAIYAAMMESVDDSVGTVMDKLDELGLAENTVFIFYSDNGGLLAWIKGWEHVTSNKPLRAGKGSLYEGGIRVPLIVRWPSAVAADSRCGVPVSSVDFYPTMLDIAGTKENPKHKSDGVSIMNVLKQTGDFQRDAIYWHFPRYNWKFKLGPGSAIRQGDYKLIKFYEGSFELYNLKYDIGETKNLADKMPKKVRQMDAKLDAWLKETDAWLPIPNPDYRPPKAKKQKQ